MKRHAKHVKDGRLKKPKIRWQLRCSSCGHVKPTLSGDGWEDAR
jgi:hypothetical protein